MPRANLLAAILLLFCFHASAQRQLGVSGSNFDAANSLFLNPANIGGCKEKYILTLFSVNALLDNNLGTLKSIGKLIGGANSNNSGIKNTFNYTGNLKFSMLAPMAEIRGPGIIIGLNNQHSLAFTTRLRVFNQFYNFNRLLYDVALKNPQTVSLNLNMKNFKWTLHTWSEAGLSYGGILVDNNKCQVKVGIKVNLLGGVGYIGLDGRNLDLSYTSGIDSIGAKNANLVLSSSIYNADNAISANQIMGNMFGGGGRGFGGDAGIVYKSKSGNENSSAKDDDYYKFALSLSITDLGSITYDRMSDATITGSGSLESAGLSASVKNYGELNKYLASRGYKNNTVIKPDIVYLPTAVLGSIDYFMIPNFYANLSMVVNVADDYRFGNKYFSQITLTPRYDTKKMTIGIPLTYNTLTHNIRFGLGARYSSLFIGSDDILLLFMSGQYGFNIYCGGSIIIPKKGNVKPGW